ncbi:MAG: hypothetical protein EXS36_00460 [Pedosphaera sp.]|nr:hypothetical protein [Pedosphaera sp.]
MMAASYIGGGVNFLALKASYGVRAEDLKSAHCLRQLRDGGHLCHTARHRREPLVPGTFPASALARCRRRGREDPRRLTLAAERHRADRRGKVLRLRGRRVGRRGGTPDKKRVWRCDARGHGPSDDRGALYE